MPGYEIPFHIQEEILKRLPVKSLVQFRSVSKAWKSLIDSSQFIAAHSLRRFTQPKHLLVWFQNPLKPRKYVCYIDDDTFPQQRSVLNIPRIVKFSEVVGCSHGLLCLYGADPNFGTTAVALCNLLIRKSIVVDLPNDPDELDVGFGVCPVTIDPKIVTITRSCDDPDKTIDRFEVMVYTLSSGKWRSLSDNLPTKRLQYVSYLAVTDRFIYWRAVSLTHLMILSFDVTNENFEVIDLPDSLARLDNSVLNFKTLRESLVMLDYKEHICTVWMMEHGVQKSCTKLFTIEILHGYIVGFRKSGIPIVEVADDYINSHEFELVVYEPNSEHDIEHDIVLEISGDHFNVNSYVETLLLLGRSDCSSY